LIRYRLPRERYIRRTAEEMLPTRFAAFRMISFESEIDGGELHAAVVLGDVAGGMPTLVRVHSHCLHGEAFGSTSCNCRSLIDQSLRAIALEGRGVLVYLRIPGNDCRSAARMACARPDKERGEGAERTLRRVGLGSQILSDLGVQKIRLLTNTPTRVPALHGFDLDIIECVPLFSPDWVSTGADTAVEDHVLSAL
jgi:3,4-dihydroxy 2-butanone 4-phosphate synthase/GTP cyclohydrolase II